MRSRNDLALSLEAYSTSFHEEKKFVSQFLELLTHPRAYFRDHLPGHMTGSAWIVDEFQEHALLLHHAKLDRWLQPGGHADGDENIVAVARKEAEEETGLKNLRLLHPLFDIDIHRIPERKDFPAHDHYDIRCLFMADRKEQIILSHESHELAWIPLTEIPAKVGQNDSIVRMIQKLR
jgi:8-oxo-dGTP pyrophosphatase MutT (NUDIX family)